MVGANDVWQANRPKCLACMLEVVVKGVNIFTIKTQSIPPEGFIGFLIVGFAAFANAMKLLVV
jgi:hypothetical protein